MTAAADRAPRVVLITGAGQGIGAAIARRFAADGERLALVDVNAEQLQGFAAELEAAGCDVLPVCADITDKARVGQLMAEVVDRFGRLDVLVNNAGIIRDGFISKLSEEDWDQVLDVNLKGAFLCCQAAFPTMKARQYGKIVNIVSRAWLGNIGQANYSASKGGLVSLTRTLALEFARFQINVNAVAPGLIDTPMTRGMPEEARQRLIRMQPTGRMGKVENVAAAVAFLASDDAEFITGQVLHVDGGKSCGLLSL
ncbi:3-oxoacyl-[acyl-carrier protein] reductase [Geothermobacter ehrlichii]|uniref:3-oxoacyl-[acyl-carrier-protein] reductase FabG n=1 Tax=Geothermobacter ehrlichii TaxID=213224 RepID=A0A5D3WP35_9BACT|nr:SDR family NAD(P)-dependent oxidoreductase [Geothermobacter ehrlichii]TYO99409.1 3-oxoacyl-[acyl-carrier protein] reductase [Geothermobacter ehrlichii]